jgi:3-oxoacyl-[acyl-carrier protein] reductase
MISADLKTKKALVTGAASGIGFGTAELLARCGARVALNDISPRLDDAAARLRAAGLDVVAVPGNVGDPAAGPAIVERCVATLGGLDYLVNNAGTPGTKRPIPPSDLARQDDEFWNRLLAVNLIGPFRLVRAAVPHLKATRGAIVNTASISAFGGGGSSSVYAITKAGLVNMTKELARGLGPEIRVNAIAPGMVESDWECRFDEEKQQEAIATMPLRRKGFPSDYAEVILFLCAGAGYVTGQTITVDGGLTC